MNPKIHFTEPIWGYNHWLVYFAVVIVVIMWGCSKYKLVDLVLVCWRWLTGQKIILHTQPYYLAITRSSCEVS